MLKVAGHESAPHRSPPKRLDFEWQSQDTRGGGGGEIDDAESKAFLLLCASSRHFLPIRRTRMPFALCSSPLTPPSTHISAVDLPRWI